MTSQDIRGPRKRGRSPRPAPAAGLVDWVIRPGGREVWSEEMFVLHRIEPESPGPAAWPLPAPPPERWLEQIHPDDRARIRAIREGLSESTGESITFVYRTNPVAGRTRSFEAHMRTVSDAVGGGEWQGTVIDVTERERQSTELRQRMTSERVGRLAGGIAHDFNNILSEIIGFTGFVKDTLGPQDPRREDVIAVLNAANRAVDLTRQMLEFSRQHPTDRHLIDLNQLVDRLGPTLRRAVGERFTLSIEPALHAALVLVDPVQFDQVILNLVTSARDAISDGGLLRLSVTVEDAEARIRVAGTERHTGDITAGRFEPCFTAKPRGRRHIGLGLATCFEIVEGAGGSIEVESPAEQAATFLVTLPLGVAPGADEGARADPITRRESRAELLVCEDEDGLRRVTARILEQAGYRVHVARDGAEAIRLIDELGPRLSAIVSDVVMPGCTGVAVAAHAASVSPKVPVLLTSGHVDDTRGAPCTSVVLRKPVPPAELVFAVATAIAKAG